MPIPHGAALQAQKSCALLGSGDRPADDRVETFARYLRIHETGHLGPVPPSAGAGIEMWLLLSGSLNIVRSMGHDDLCPFVLPATVLDKM